MFWVDPAAGTLAWDKPGKKSSKPNKGPFPLVSVLPDIPPERDARAWFKQADADGSGELDADELAALYKKAREEKLSKARLKEAMAATTCVAWSAGECVPLHAAEAWRRWGPCNWSWGRCGYCARSAG